MASLDYFTRQWIFLLTLLMTQDFRTYATPGWPAMEKEHDPEFAATSPPDTVNGTKMPDPLTTPDYRLEEPPWKAYDGGSYKYLEEDRPFRISPHYQATLNWINRPNPYFSYWNLLFMSGSKHIERPEDLGCYCTTVYRRLTPLAGCAVLTPRHILTTASSTELVIRDRHNDKTLVNVLGAWYDISDNVLNSSQYMTPARIHYHPRYLREHMVNISHPLPMVYDLALWASTYNFHTSFCSCLRSNSGTRNTYHSPAPIGGDLVIIVGFQYIKSLRKKPIPFIKYAVRTKRWLNQCPKTEWGWYLCINGKEWAKYGIESGAAYHRSTSDYYHEYQGLVGLHAFSLRLRSQEIVHYFTPISTHPVLEFIYDAYMGMLPYEYLDQRFHNNKWRAPRGKSWYDIPYDEGSSSSAFDSVYYNKGFQPYN